MRDSSFPISINFYLILLKYALKILFNKQNLNFKIKILNVDDIKLKFT